MDTLKLKEVFSSAYRQYARVLAVVVVGVLMGALLTFVILPHAVVEAPTIGGDENNATTSSKFARSAPIQIVIPKIGVDTTFVPPLGLNPDKTVSVPDNYIQVGWYSGGATPGEVGPSVILGHVDSFEGPAVFYKLGKLEAGDEVTITRADGTIAVFEVIDTERYSQDAFPTEKVYGPIDFAGLRLITCTGTFNKAEQKYSHNTVVYAKLKE
jgi:hypothetical protein